MNETKRQAHIFLLCATVFISSFCIMALELVAGRLTARILGSSLYTWTSVIGVILTGITLGNYLGGRIADESSAKKTLASIFAICSVSCVTSIILNNRVGGWIWLWHLNWPLRVFIHTSLIFLLPSALLGTICPVIAKMALEHGLPPGRTIGDIYAWSAAGSIAGTFAAGFYLISAVGTTNIIWIMSAGLLLMSFLFQKRYMPLYVWSVIFIVFMIIAMTPARWAQNISSSIALTGPFNPDILYEDDTRYCHITVRQDSADPNRRFFTQDKLLHSEILMNDILNLQYFYAKIYASVTQGLCKDKEKLSVMVIGGGGYVFPRFIEKVWPGSKIDVAEIDPDVTKAATLAFGLSPDAPINTINLDARNYVDGLLEQKRNGVEIPAYDFIYGDAFNDYSVPFQLVTRQFDEKIYRILSGSGVYMINMIDIFDSGLFLGSVVNTLKEVFPYVYVLAEPGYRSSRNTFVVIASKIKLDLKNIISQGKWKNLKLWYLNDSDIAKLKEKSHEIILTDNYCPVENLLASVVCESTKVYSANKYLEKAEQCRAKGNFNQSIKYLRLAIKTYPVCSLQAYNEIGIICGATGNLEKAVEAFYEALKFNREAEYKVSVSGIHFSIAIALIKQGKNDQAAKELQNAMQGFRKDIAEKPDSQAAWSGLGDTLAAMRNFSAAAQAYKKALDLNPAQPEYYGSLEMALEYDGKYNQAIEVLKKHIQLMKDNKQDKEVLDLQNYLKSLEYKNSQIKQP